MKKALRELLMPARPERPMSATEIKRAIKDQLTTLRTVGLDELSEEKLIAWRERIRVLLKLEFMLRHPVEKSHLSSITNGKITLAGEKLELLRKRASEQADKLARVIEASMRRGDDAT
jgi:hypothetical protein